MEFQAVVLAGGRGSRFTDLTNSKGKCLLPVGNMPLIWYSLDNLVKLGFKEAIVLVNDAVKSEVAGIPDKYNLSISLDIVSVSSLGQEHGECDDEEECGSTGDALRLIHPKIHAPRVLLISSDLITTLSPIHQLTDLHRIHRSAFTALFFKDKPIDTKKLPGPKSKHKKERDIIGLDKSHHNQICFLSSEADLEENLTLKRSLLKEHSRISFHTNLNDAHLYVVEKWVLDFLSAKKGMSTVKGELFPHLVKKQFSSKTFVTVKKEDNMLFDENLNKPTGISNYIQTDDMILQAQSLSNWNDNLGDLSNAYRDRGLRCYAHVSDELIYRVNNLPNYCAVNRNIKELAETFNIPSDTRKDKGTTRPTIGEGCFIGSGTLIKSKTTIQNTMIGSNCKIAEKVKLTDCVVMDGVSVQEGSNIQGSVICDNVTIEPKCDIQDCIIGSGYTIQTGKRKNEVIQEIDKMMEI
uniref:Translation initiation factor eIF2B subunit gamma n=1 Tax=Lepeophtheirus salmonis TaxID=72036 RepID=D3PIK8_LEPSM|nr:Translation initiation factor eIF-2B subunit gamma [Lepeophtheirus salmonis]